jgi:hypothetical protein
MLSRARYNNSLGHIQFLKGYYSFPIFILLGLIGDRQVN